MSHGVRAKCTEAYAGKTPFGCLSCCQSTVTSQRLISEPLDYFLDYFCCFVHHKWPKAVDVVELLWSTQSIVIAVKVVNVFAVSPHILCGRKIPHRIRNNYQYFHPGPSVMTVLSILSVPVPYLQRLLDYLLCESQICWEDKSTVGTWYCTLETSFGVRRFTSQQRLRQLTVIVHFIFSRGIVISFSSTRGIIILSPEGYIAKCTTGRLLSPFTLAPVVLLLPYLYLHRCCRCK